MYQGHGTSWALIRCLSDIYKVDVKLALLRTRLMSLCASCVAGSSEFSSIVSELLSTASSLVTLLNDTILRKAANLPESMVGHPFEMQYWQLLYKFYKCRTFWAISISLPTSGLEALSFSVVCQCFCLSVHPIKFVSIQTLELNITFAANFQGWRGMT